MDGVSPRLATAARLRRSVSLRLPTGAWRDLLTGTRHVADAEGLRLAPVLDRLPVALLTRD